MNLHHHSDTPPPPESVATVRRRVLLARVVDTRPDGITHLLELADLALSSAEVAL
ncbi:hypothetical protein SAMN05445060_1972 [Williamsia sterculiae]|uniref:Uncharacterized protein n=1 Tax=Williamsia sterculiae TaxID=1344003 RepID=A0A1N7FDR6_9NOCA|nr:hypothetical protein SAMN05445060_1972 [Williamsia sterculiae]